ncbi:hypothetical protein HG536_0B01800 [Torulaspora globosa]|uniref:ADF-H domain-containing protein n=1 Tax=Torulaspora globosa TaxID=48254 RepID=A0A7G3ZCT1_9SACH|nr:uncharacterized protein HG536_0B01800 [Torulaspora globosa]QLL31317.1 hypothetical protein HG536_0B01800 [Torulaspora globosa]
MSNQSGILADQNLLDLLSNPDSNEVFAITAQISKDATAVQFSAKYSSLEQVIDNLAEEPLYVFIRGTLEDPKQYHFISYVPDSSPVRSKMLYASTKNTLVRQIGTSGIGRQSLLTDASELLQVVDERNAQEASVLTESEKADIEIAQQQQRLKASEYYPNGRKLVSQTDGVPKSLAFRVKTGEGSIAELMKNYNVISFRIDLASEQIQVAAKYNIDSPRKVEIVEDHPSYVIYRNGSLYYFIYCCPSGSKVRDRMVYASNRAGFIKHLKDEDHLELAKIIEIGDPEELELSSLSPSTPEALAAEDAESKSASDVKFSRPKGPTRKRRT